MSVRLARQNISVKASQFIVDEPSPSQVSSSSEQQYWKGPHAKERLQEHPKPNRRVLEQNQGPAEAVHRTERARVSGCV